MVTTGQMLPTLGSTHQLLPAGWDGGFGNAKLIVEKQQTKVLSYLAFLHNDNSYEVADEGSLIEYVAGDRSELVGRRWFTGFPACQEFPTSFIQMVDDYESKIKFGLQLFLGTLGTLPYRSNWDLLVQASIQDAQVFGDDLKKALEGRHIVKVNGKEVSTVRLEVLPPAEEGKGAIAQAYITGLAAPNNQVILLDIGHGTLIVSAFGAEGRLIRDSRKVIQGGVDALVSAVAKNKDMRRHLRQEGDEVVIRAGIEKGDFSYGETGWSFKDVYTAELKPWVQAVLLPALKAVKPWRATSKYVLGIGGGVNLPGISSSLIKQGITPIPDSQSANVRGLAEIARLQLQKLRRA
jgi:hypothetical protein